MASIQETPIALQLWSVNAACKENFAETLKAVSEMGYDGVEFAGFHGMVAEELKQRCADLGLKIAGSHTGLPLLEGDMFAETTAYNLTLGNDKLIIPCFPGDRAGKSISEWKSIIETIQDIQTRLKDLGLKTGFHNHAKEFDALEGGTLFDTIFSNTDNEFIMQMDIGWAFHAGVDARDYFKKYPGRSETVHVKAHSATNETACLGEDDVPWPEVLQCAVETGNTEWFIVEHERHDGEPLENVKTCLDYLKSL